MMKCFESKAGLRSFRRAEKRIMGEGLNFKVPIAERVIKVGVKVQPHPFKEIDASSKEYQMVKMTGMMNFHIDPAYVNDLYQKVGLDFADKVIDPAFNDFVKEVVPTYPIGEILPKREELRQRERLNPFLWWLRDRPKPMMPYHGRSARSSCSTRALRNGMGFYLKSLGEPSPSSIWGRWVARRAKQKEAKNKLRVQGWEFEVGSHR